MRFRTPFLRYALNNAEMSTFSRNTTKLPLEQETIRAKCSGEFVGMRRHGIEQSIPNCFEQQVAKHRDSVAVKSRSHEFSYGKLNQLANRIARGILARLGKKEEPIALLLGHDAGMIASIIGVMKSGKICVPLETTCPLPRSRYILEDSETKLLVTDNTYLSLARELIDGRISLINIDELDAELSDDNIGLSISPETLVFILYTSGSTGQPKGVMQTHRNALHSAMAYVDTLHIQTDDRWILLGSCSGAQGLKTVISALVAGAALYPWNIQEDGLSDLANWLITEGITVYISGATVFRSFVASLQGTEQFPSLRVVRLGNEPVRIADLQLCQHFFPDCFFVNWFAATETGNIACWFFDGNTNSHAEFLPVGYGFDDLEIRLLDDQGRQVGFNQVGEIAIKSRYLSPGYWRRPDFTRTRFLPDPNGGEERTFLSGDRGLMLPDGCLYHLGRKDFQVKIRGNRIEVGDVESALLALAEIKDAAVIALDRAGDKRLVAYIVAAQKPPPSVGTLRRALAEKLPDYMIPSAFVMLDAMPVTPNGKIDRRALPDFDGSRPESLVAYVAPRTPVEEILARIWADVIGITPIGIHDHFFELGGDSLSATRLISRVLKEFQAQVPLKFLFQAPTIAEMGALITMYQGYGLDENELGKLLNEVESLSDEEVQRLVSEGRRRDS